MPEINILTLGVPDVNFSWFFLAYFLLQQNGNEVEHSTSLRSVLFRKKKEEEDFSGFGKGGGGLIKGDF